MQTNRMVPSGPRDVGGGKSIQVIKLHVSTGKAEQ